MSLYDRYSSLDAAADRAMADYAREAKLLLRELTSCDARTDLEEIALKAEGLAEMSQALVARLKELQPGDDAEVPGPDMSWVHDQRYR